LFRPSDNTAELHEEEFRLLRDFIHERFGLYFEDYYRYLRFGPQRQEEVSHMVSHLTNNETYFYREMPQLQVFADHVLKQLKDKKAREGGRSLRILSAGCSTGEEALSLAMIVYDSAQFFWNWDVQVTGLDVDEAALDKARRGVYHQNSFRALSPALLERHFVRQGASAQVKEGVRKIVSFRQGNLLEPLSFSGLDPMDVIFCRNVLIYFSDTATLRAVRQFSELLRPGGYLFLGHAESLSRVTDMFTPIRFQGAMVYQKPERP
jgi:chemotaxis protein methyltransferase CheR